MFAKQNKTESLQTRYVFKTRQDNMKTYKTNENKTNKQNKHGKFTDTTIYSKTLQAYKHDKMTDTVSLQNKTNQSIQTRYVYKTKLTNMPTSLQIRQVSLQTRRVDRHRKFTKQYKT